MQVGSFFIFCTAVRLFSHPGDTPRRGRVAATAAMAMVVELALFALTAFYSL